MCRRRVGGGLLGLLLAATPVSAQYVTDVPYFHQYFNSINPSVFCQNTTIAITLAYYGADLHPMICPANMERKRRRPSTVGRRYSMPSHGVSV